MVQDNKKTIHEGNPQTYVSPLVRTLALENRCAILASSKTEIKSSSQGDLTFGTATMGSSSWQ